MLLESLSAGGVTSDFIKGLFFDGDKLPDYDNRDDL
jgi:hypothetical protein